MAANLLYSAIAGFVVGIFVVSLWPSLIGDVWLLVLLGGIFLAVVGRGGEASPANPIILLAIFTFAVALGMWRTHLYTESLTVISADLNEVALEGVVIREPDQRSRTTHLYIKTDNATVLVFADRYQSISYGDRVRVRGKLSFPSSFDTDLGRTFNYPGYLNTRGVTQVISYPEIEILETGQGNFIISTLLAVKQQFIDRIEANLPEPQSGLSQGLLLGVKRALGSDLEEAFRSTGIIHIVVLSGYNIMLVVAFVLYLLSFVFPWRGRLFLGLLAIVAFALLVGLSATVVRASLMAALALVARSLGRTYSVLRALLVAGVLMLIINPYLLVFDVGFQLSFLATTGLILIAPHLSVSLERVPAFIGIREFLVATLATQLFVLPILLYQIGEFSVVSVLVNVLVLPMVPVAMFLTFLMVIASFISVKITFLLSLLSYGALTYISTIPTWFATLPFASFVVPPFPFVLVPLAYGLIGYLIYWWIKPTDPLADWVIEEDRTEDESVAITSNHKTETPIFFR